MKQKVSDMPFIEAKILVDGEEKIIKAKSDVLGVCFMRFMWKIRYHAKKENKLISVKTNSLAIASYLSEHLPDVTVEYDTY